jgi:hypothetical protein
MDNRKWRAWTKYKEKENLVMRINEITNSNDKLELLRMIDAAIWHAFDAERFYADNDDTEAEQGVAVAPVNTNQVAPKPAAIQKPTTPVKKLTQQQQAHVKTLGPKELLNYIKTNLKAPAAATPKPATPIRPNSNATPATNNNNSQVPNASFDTVNTRNDTAKNKDDEQGRQA